MEGLGVGGRQGRRGTERAPLQLDGAIGLDQKNAIEGVFSAATLWLSQFADRAINANKKPLKYRTEDHQKITEDQAYLAITNILTQVSISTPTPEIHLTEGYINSHPNDGRELLSGLRGQLANIKNPGNKLMRGMAQAGALMVKESNLYTELLKACTELVGPEFASLHLTSMVIAKREEPREVTVPEDLPVRR